MRASLSPELTDLLRAADPRARVMVEADVVTAEDRRQRKDQWTLADSTAGLTLLLPAGAALAVCAQYKNLGSGGQTQLDIGAGFGGFASAAAPFTVFGNQVVRVGGVNLGGNPLFGVLIDLLIARGLFTKAEMEAVP
jgi:hypothetical protein